MTERRLRILEENCLNIANRLYCSLQQLAIAASEILGYEVVADILLKDLCARVPYRTFVCLNPGAYNKPETCILTGVHGEKVHLNVDSDPFRVDHIKPYLRPLSSMTDKEKDELYTAMDWYGEIDESGNVYTKGQEKVYRETFYEYTDWLISHHFDYHGLIEKGLALEAPEDMYKTE